jgi:hypothetical protein
MITSPDGLIIGSRQIPIGIEIPVHRYRVLFSDGEVLNFLAARDDSDIRGQMFEIHYGKPRKDDRDGKAIAGVVDLGVEYRHCPSQLGGTEFEQ